MRVLVHPVPGVRDHEDDRAVRPRGLGVTLGVAVHTHHPLAPVSGEYHQSLPRISPVCCENHPSLANITRLLRESPVSGENQLYLAKRQNHPFPMHGDQSPVIVTCISQQYDMYVFAVLVLGSHDPSLAKLTVYCNCGHWPGHHWAPGTGSLTEPSSVWISIVTTSTLPSTGGLSFNINAVMTSQYHLSLMLQAITLLC